DLSARTRMPRAARVRTWVWAGAPGRRRRRLTHELERRGGRGHPPPGRGHAPPGLRARGALRRRPPPAAHPPRPPPPPEPPGQPAPRRRRRTRDHLPTPASGGRRILVCDLVREQLRQLAAHDIFRIPEERAHVRQILDHLFGALVAILSVVRERTQR